VTVLQLNLPARRVALAIGLSLLVHAALLFGPNLIQLAPVEVPLPPLTARLEPLPAVKLAPKPKPRAHAKPKPVTPPPAPEAVTAEAPPAETPETTTDATPQAEVPASAVPAENTEPAYPLPRHAQLTFIAYMGTNFPVGEVRHRLDVNDDKSYTLQVGMNTTGVARIFKTFELSQQSTGMITAGGIRPDRFIENKLTSKGKQILSADFDWQNRKLNFSNGNSSPLPDQAQDILSFLYQFSQMPLDQARLPMRVSNGKKLESYELEVGAEEEIQTRFGRLRVLPLRKVNAPGEEGLEIWLGLEYRLLPVQIRSIDKNGKIAGQMVISDIRVSDE
jgi:hypothetical protein